MIIGIVIGLALLALFATFLFLFIWAVLSGKK